MSGHPPTLCARGHRVVFTTGDCYTLAELEPGLFEYVIGPCEAVMRAEGRPGGEVGLGLSRSGREGGKDSSERPGPGSAPDSQASDSKTLPACGAPEPSKIENLADLRPQSTLLNVDENTETPRMIQR